MNLVSIFCTLKFYILFKCQDTDEANEMAMLEGNADIVEASQSNEVSQAVGDMQPVVEGG